MGPKGRRATCRGLRRTARWSGSSSTERQVRTRRSCTEVGNRNGLTRRETGNCSHLLVHRAAQLVPGGFFRPRHLGVRMRHHCLLYARRCWLLRAVRNADVRRPRPTDRISDGTPRRPLHSPRESFDATSISRDGLPVHPISVYVLMCHLVTAAAPWAPRWPHHSLVPRQLPCPGD